MKVAYFDCPSGASGDMILGALVDAGVSLDALRTELAKLPLGDYRLTAREVRKGAFRATKVDVEVDATAHHQRNLPEILRLLEQSGLPGRVKADAARIFTRLAAAEARVHGTTVEAVHFHDVGAVDALVEVSGAGAGLRPLGVGGGHVSGPPRRGRRPRPRSPGLRGPCRR